MRYIANQVVFNNDEKEQQLENKRPMGHIVKIFSQFRKYLPLEKGGALHLNKLESPSPKDALCQV